jgi:hypothetical protein
MDNITDLLTNFFVSKNTKPIQSSIKKSLSNDSSITESNQSKKSSDYKSDSTISTISTDSSDSTISTDSSDSNDSNDSSDSSDSNNSNDSSDYKKSLDYNSNNLSNEIKKSEELNILPSNNVLKKIILKAFEFYKNNILLINNDKSKNLEIISDLLFKLTNMTDVKNIYENSLHIFTSNEHKEYFRDMLLENPYLYFNELIIKNTLSIPKLESNKRHIFIIDYNIILDIDKLTKLVSQNNIHLIVMHDTYTSTLLNIYKILGNNTIIINNKDRLKILQNKFYSKIVKNIKYIDNYSELINDDNLDIKYLIIKNNELSYS